MPNERLCLQLFKNQDKLSSTENCVSAVMCSLCWAYKTCIHLWLARDRHLRTRRMHVASCATDTRRHGQNRNMVNEISWKPIYRVPQWIDWPTDKRFQYITITTNITKNICRKLFPKKTSLQRVLLRLTGTFSFWKNIDVELFKSAAFSDATEMKSHTAQCQYIHPYVWQQRNIHLHSACMSVCVGTDTESNAGFISEPHFIFITRP